ncbi:MAG: hypothetical protein MUE44_36840 [Oscillatoriaceae cyanobacterium Prado104]|nr:hypothetical protein [Oscillatoriaceae cyanobacterium Prado104]
MARSSLLDAAARIPSELRGWKVAERSQLNGQDCFLCDRTSVRRYSSKIH